MILLADENVEQQIVAHLRKAGHDVYSVLEMEPSIDDDVVLARTNEFNAVLITGDKDFGEMVYRQGLVHAGVILVRLAGVHPQTKGRIVSAVVGEREAELFNSFTVISPGLVRIRHQM